MYTYRNEASITCFAKRNLGHLVEHEGLGYQGERRLGNFGRLAICFYDSEGSNLLRK